MIEFVVFIIVANILFEFIQLVFPLKRLSGFVRSFFSLLLIYLVCLKLKNYF